MGVKVSKFLVVSDPYLQVTWHTACASAIFSPENALQWGRYRVNYP